MMSAVTHDLRRTGHSSQTKVSVFPAAALLQTGFPLRSNRFQPFFSSLTPSDSVPSAYLS
jgi:hypothetical protein